MKLYDLTDARIELLRDRIARYHALPEEMQEDYDTELQYVEDNEELEYLLDYTGI